VTTEPFEGQTGSTAKLELKRACAAPPGALVVAQDTVLGKALAARWAATVPAGGPPHECTLEQYLHHEPETLSEGQWQDTFTAILKCPEASVSAEVAMRPGPGVDLASKLLVERLAAKLCR
jgi:hypothetical protein